MINHLEELRKQRGIRQEDLAQALGVSRQTRHLAGKGKVQPFSIAGFQTRAVF